MAPQIPDNMPLLQALKELFYETQDRAYINALNDAIEVAAYYEELLRDDETEDAQGLTINGDWSSQ